MVVNDANVALLTSKMMMLLVALNTIAVGSLALEVIFSNPSVKLLSAIFTLVVSLSLPYCVYKGIRDKVRLTPALSSIKYHDQCEPLFSSECVVHTVFLLVSHRTTLFFDSRLQIVSSFSTFFAFYYFVLMIIAFGASRGFQILIDIFLLVVFFRTTTLSRELQKEVTEIMPATARYTYVLITTRPTQPYFTARRMIPSQSSLPSQTREVYAQPIASVQMVDSASVTLVPQDEAYAHPRAAVQRVDASSVSVIPVDMNGRPIYEGLKAGSTVPEAVGVAVQTAHIVLVSSYIPGVTRVE